MKRARRWVYFVEILWTWIIEGLRDIYTESWYLISINSIKMFPNWMCFHTGKRVLRLGYSFYFKILEAWRSGSVVPWGKPQAQRFRILGGQGSGRCTKALGPSNQGAPSLVRSEPVAILALWTGTMATSEQTTDPILHGWESAKLRLWGGSETTFMEVQSRFRREACDVVAMIKPVFKRIW